MADTKISALTELTAPVSGDWVPVVDVSDTTMAASGTTKKLDLSALSGGDQTFVVGTNGAFQTIEAALEHVKTLPQATLVDTLTTSGATAQNATAVQTYLASQVYQNGGMFLLFDGDTHYYPTLEAPSGGYGFELVSGYPVSGGISGSTSFGVYRPIVYIIEVQAGHYSGSSEVDFSSMELANFIIRGQAPMATKWDNEGAANATKFFKAPVAGILGFQDISINVKRNNSWFIESLTRTNPQLIYYFDNVWFDSQARTITSVVECYGAAIYASNVKCLGTTSNGFEAYCDLVLIDGMQFEGETSGTKPGVTCLIDEPNQTARDWTIKNVGKGNNLGQIFKGTIDSGTTAGLSKNINISGVSGGDSTTFLFNNQSNTDINVKLDGQIGTFLISGDATNTGEINVFMAPNSVIGGTVPTGDINNHPVTITWANATATQTGTVTVNPADDLIMLDGTSAVTCNLPSAAVCKGRIFLFWDINGSTGVSIDAGSELINSSASPFAMATAADAMTIVTSNGVEFNAKNL